MISGVGWASGGPRLVAFRLRIELRAHWRSVLAAAVILGVAGGAALAAAAGARRADTATERLVQAARAPDVLVLPYSASAMDSLTSAALTAIPGVTSVQMLYGHLAMPVGHDVPDIAMIVPPEGGDPVAGELVRDGRRPDPTNPDEVIINENLANATGWRVGDTITLQTLPEVNFRNAEQYPDDSLERFMRGELGERRDFQVVGITLDVGDVQRTNETRMIFTKAYYDETHAGPVYAGIGVRLDDGRAGTGAFQTAVNELARGEPVTFQTSDSILAAEGRSLQPQVATLWAFAGVMALVAVVAWAQAARRRVRLSDEERATVRVLGVTTGGQRRVDLAYTVLVVIAGTTLAVLVGWVLSPLLPLGDARRVEPHRGADFDPAALLGGAALLFVLASTVGLVACRRAAGAGRARPARLPDLAARIGAHTPSAQVGMSHALGAGGNGVGAVSRSTLAGAAGGVLATLAAVTFSANLTRFERSPLEYGSGFDVLIDVGGVTDQRLDTTAVSSALAADSDVAAWVPLALATVDLDGHNTPTLAIGAGSGTPFGPTVVTGRLPTARDEIALGIVTARDRHVGLGDTITAGAQPMRVVGTVVLPGINDNDADRAELGRGATMTLDGMVATSRFESDGVTAERLIVRLAPGITPSDFAAHLPDLLPDGYGAAIQLTGEGLPQHVDQSLKPTEVLALGDVRVVPLALAALLALLAATTVGFALVTSTHRRRREFGTLATLGFTPGQIRSTVAWHASTVAVVASVVGVPLGVLVGRQAWLAVARQIGVEPVATMPWMAIALTLPVTLIVANAAAFVPAYRTGAVSPATALRSEAG